MNCLGLIVVTLLLFAIAYRFYGAFIAARVLQLSDFNVTPANRLEDGRNYHAMNKYVVFGHHFAAIAGPGPLVGPVLAAQFGYLPGTLWILIGAVLAGGVHDLVILVASIRSNGKSLAEIAKDNISPLSGVMALIAILFMGVTAVAGLAMVVVNTLAESAWGTFTIFLTIPIAMYVGLHMEVFRKGKIREASIIGVVLVLGAVFFGGMIHMSPIAGFFTFSKQQITFAIIIYGFLASVLPIWLLLAPRDYLSSYMKIGTIAILTLGIIIVNPEFHTPALTKYIHGGGPIIPGTVWPFVFITIACGALSGAHAIIATGTSPKLISREKDALFIGYGAMLFEGFVSITAIISASVLLPNDYLAINVDPSKWAALGIVPVELDNLSRMVNESLAGRTGGAVTLAVGMAHIFSRIPGMGHLMAYWYHYAIMFEALFILTTVDAFTRVGRYMFQETIGRFSPKMGRINYWPSVFLTSALFCAAWGYLLYQNDISSIWPMFGVANQLLATLTLVVCTCWLLNNTSKKRYALLTAVPAVLMAVTTFAAGYLVIVDRFFPMAMRGEINGWLNTIFTLVMMVCMVVTFIDGSWRIAKKLRG